MANPMYRQIAEELREQIESGVLRSGQQLKTELELRETYDASRNTVRDAIKWLAEFRPGRDTSQARAPSSRGREWTDSSLFLLAIPARTGATENAAYPSEGQRLMGRLSSAQSRWRSSKPLMTSLRRCR